jgi:hypothetical protein
MSQQLRPQHHSLASCLDRSTTAVFVSIAAASGKAVPIPQQTVLETEI